MKDAKLTSPEAQIITSPTIVGFLNGIMSMVDTGLSNCYGGFGLKAVSKFMNVNFLNPLMRRTKMLIFFTPLKLR